MHSSSLIDATRPAYLIVFKRLNVIKFLISENVNDYPCAICDRL